MALGRERTMAKSGRSFFFFLAHFYFFSSFWTSLGHRIHTLFYYYCVTFFHFIFFVKMTTKKKPTKPQRRHVLRCTQSHFRFFSRSAPLILYPTTTKKWAKKCSVGNVFDDFSTKNKKFHPKRENIHPKLLLYLFRCRSPRFLPSIFIAHRVQQSHCSSIFHRVLLLTQTLALSAQVNLCTIKNANEFIRVCTRRGSNSRKLTYTRLEDNLICHRGATGSLCPPGIFERCG